MGADIVNIDWIADATDADLFLGMLDMQERDEVIAACNALDDEDDSDA